MSGYKQSENILSPSYYRVTIDMADFSVAATSTGGGCTPNSSDSFSTANLPTTLAAGQQRARGNIRFQQVVLALSNIADVQIIDVEVTGDLTGDHQATALTFTARYERPQGILGTVRNIVGTPYTAADNATEITTDLLALKDQITRALAQTRSQTYRVYNGTVKEDFNLVVSVAPPIADIPTLWSKIGVAQIDGTEIISVI